MDVKSTKGAKKTKAGVVEELRLLLEGRYVFGKQSRFQKTPQSVAQRRLGLARGTYVMGADLYFQEV
jgi:hypothetical protein